MGRALHVTRNELEFRIFIARAGPIEDADPGAHIELAARVSGSFHVLEVVIRPPGDTGGLIGHARAVRCGLPRRNVPHQGGARDQTPWQLGQGDAGVMWQELYAAVVTPQCEAALGREQRAGK